MADKNGMLYCHCEDCCNSGGRMAYCCCPCEECKTCNQED